MTGSPIFRELANVEKLLHTNMRTLIPVQIHRRSATGSRSTITGDLEFEAPITVNARIDGLDEELISSDRTLQTARYTLTIFGQNVNPHDKVTWGGQDHEVLAVGDKIRRRELISNLVENAEGQRYKALVITD